MKEKDIKHESSDGIHWVADLKDSYAVMKTALSNYDQDMYAASQSNFGLN